MSAELGSENLNNFKYPYVPLVEISMSDEQPVSNIEDFAREIARNVVASPIHFSGFGNMDKKIIYHTSLFSREALASCYFIREQFSKFAVQHSVHAVPAESTHHSSQHLFLGNIFEADVEKVQHILENFAGDYPARLTKLSIFKKEEGSLSVTLQKDFPLAELSIGNIYKHTKSGKLYKVVGLSRNTESLELYVEYEPLYTESIAAKWNRPLRMFTENLLIDGEVKPRFTLIDNLS